MSEQQLDLIAGAAEQAVMDGILSPESSHWPQRLADMLAVAESALRKQGCPAEQAATLAVAVVLDIARYQGGRMFYLPTGKKLQTALRHAQAWRMWRGNNIDEVMTFLGVSDCAAYAILAQQRDLHRSRLQQSLPLPPVDGAK